ncbi:MAG: hypothetical protein WCL49_02945 [bacterium]
MVTQTLRQSLVACIIALTILTAHFQAWSAPLKIENEEASQAPSEEFQGIVTNNSPSVLFSIHQNPDSGKKPEAWLENTNGLTLAGLISERLYNLDIGILEAELQKNDIMCRRQFAQLNPEIDVFLEDLHPSTPKTDELDAIMKQVGKAIAEQKASSAQNEVQGWKSAIVCLIMVAMVFVVAIARR